jgi:nucleoside-diphosphate-sugar epimerase
MNFKAKTVLITGATGFLGSYLVRRFHREGARVIAASRTATAKRHAFPDGVHAIDIDIILPDTLPPATKDAEIIIHAAAKVSDWGKEYEFIESIRDGTENMLNALNKEKIERLIYISSVAVYGHAQEGAFEEDMISDTLSWPYAASKAAAEKIAMDHHRNHGIPVTIIRPTNIYGPRSRHWTDRPTELIRKRLMNLPKGFGKSNTVFVENVVEGIVCACKELAAIGEVFNISDDFLVDWDEFFLNYASVFGIRKIRVLPAWIMKSIAGSMEFTSRLTGKPPLITRLAIDFVRFQGTYSIGKAQNLLNYSPAFNKEKAFKITREYLRTKYGSTLLNKSRNQTPVR